MVNSFCYNSANKMLVHFLQKNKFFVYWFMFHDQKAHFYGQNKNNKKLALNQFNDPLFYVIYL